MQISYIVELVEKTRHGCADLKETATKWGDSQYSWKITGTCYTNTQYIHRKEVSGLRKDAVKDIKNVP